MVPLGSALRLPIVPAKKVGHARQPTSPPPFAALRRLGLTVATCRLSRLCHPQAGQPQPPSRRQGDIVRQSGRQRAEIDLLEMCQLRGLLPASGGGIWRSVELAQCKRYINYLAHAHRSLNDKTLSPPSNTISWLCPLASSLPLLCFGARQRGVCAICSHLFKYNAHTHTLQTYTRQQCVLTLLH